jgi:hypothetical protein
MARSKRRNPSRQQGQTESLMSSLTTRKSHTPSPLADISPRTSCSQARQNQTHIDTTLRNYLPKPDPTPAEHSLCDLCRVMVNEWGSTSRDVNGPATGKTSHNHYATFGKYPPTAGWLGCHVCSLLVPFPLS